MHLTLLNLTGGSLSGGYRKYLQKLLPLFYKDSCLSKLDIFVPPGTEDLLDFDTVSSFSWPREDYRRGFPWLKAKIRELGPDVVYIPTARWIDCGEIPVTIMVRNMEPLLVPFAGNPLREKIKNVFRAYIAKRCCKRGNRIIAVSQHVRDFICGRWKINPQKIGVVYHGVDLPADKKVLVAPVALHGWDREPLLFTAGSIRPARGLEDVIYAFGKLKSKATRCKLVIAGAVDPGMKNYKSKLDKLVSKLELKPQVIWSGQLSYNEMSWCYRHCVAFVMTSRAEACPNTALEAMIHGCVCISTKTQPMPEIFGDAALYYPPQNGEALAGAIKSVLSWDDHQRKTASAKAIKRAAGFSWDVCAQKTVAELLKAAA